MSVSKNIYKQLNPYFKSLGFRKHGRCFFKIENHIAFCFTPEFTSTVRIWCYILPLYMPTTFRHLDFGNNIDHVHRELKDIETHREITDAEASEWLEEIAPVIENEVLPFFKSVSSPELLLQYCDLPSHQRSPYIFWNSFKMLKLQAYTALFLGEKEIAQKAIKEFRERGSDPNLHYPSYITVHVTESYQMEKILLMSDEERTQRFESICADTVYHCFTPHKRNSKV